ncbi:hypothetical protein ABIA32_000744 [Streptacidiphilus sp. MAP12-20]
MARESGLFVEVGALDGQQVFGASAGRKVFGLATAGGRLA